ncbi:MAG: UDP-N-acetylmuramyl-tripeptide synthetase [Parcubacteria group bacterium]|nr:UDP-N-acetylmuramyl-tripeptide synthetase [Parcubacteria group bacterium]
MLAILKKIIPKKLFNALLPIYHYKLALLGAILYRFPSRQIKIVAITGTKGKTSTAEFVNAILEKAGHKTALASTLRFKIGDDSRNNVYKMTMPGRFVMQKFLRQAVSAGCKYAVIEMTSQGVVQFRHKFIYLDTLIVTNISPEHIESHGSYEKYLEAKLQIAKSLEKSSKKGKIIVVNEDDKEADKFLAITGVEKHKYNLKDAEPFTIKENGVDFTFDETKISSPLLGIFNIYNMLAAATFAKTQNISTQTIKEALDGLDEIRGRMQKIEEGQNFKVFVDYAHTIDSLEKAYNAVSNTERICVLGNTGGGRDKWKRVEMAKIADKYCSQIILTNEDPYDEDPHTIVDEMEKGIINKPYEIIMDRREAISTALQKAQDFVTSNNSENKKITVFITGKGTDPYIMGPKGSKLPWSDAEVAREELEKILK